MRRLTADDRAQYERDGYLCLPAWLDDAWLDRLTAVMDRFVERSRSLVVSTPDLLLGPGHTADRPMLRRIPQTVAFDPVFEDFGLRGPVVDLAEDLLGADVRFHHSKLNFKSGGGGEEIRWHQDIPFWPHSNYGPLTIGVYLCDVDEAMAPMGVFAGSHRGPIHALRDEAGAWTGALSDAEAARLEGSDLRWLAGPRGTVTIHNCRVVHGSRANTSPRMRPLLLHTYAPCDALPLTRIMDPVKLANVIVRGGPPAYARFDAEPCPMPPDWGAGEYSSIFSVQQEKLG
ncbi:MAG: phytanoyl-CoA dioxygenase family protein [Phenylobacterium sp.]|uniref:phytanoyl-CoA dioxygenase family protein n=1 Tax=Phenylobacterium sp. TaxID=1871053 RepID=UPI001A45E343|nr:phytanoyl-CoA dioxygenase family protein [Phenylobacterium sp.]MBL8553753.1 phytanoyl-CoA dioxygenase family protein [Phenylobacterium sp.]